MESEERRKKRVENFRKTLCANTPAQQETTHFPTQNLRKMRKKKQPVANSESKAGIAREGEKRRKRLFSRRSILSGTFFAFLLAMFALQFSQLSAFLNQVTIDRLIPSTRFEVPSCTRNVNTKFRQLFFQGLLVFGC